jgi:hypothetical protein
LHANPAKLYDGTTYWSVTPAAGQLASNTYYKLLTGLSLPVDTTSAANWVQGNSSIRTPGEY